MNLAHNKTLFSNRRWWALLIAVSVLLLMSFYAVTDGSHLANNAALSGAD